jgi:hypothetical protein
MAEIFALMGVRKTSHPKNPSDTIIIDNLRQPNCGKLLEGSLSGVECCCAEWLQGWEGMRLKGGDM